MKYKKKIILGSVIGLITGIFISMIPASTESILGIIIETLAYVSLFKTIYEPITLYILPTRPNIGLMIITNIIYTTIIGAIYSLIFSFIYENKKSSFYGLIIGALSSIATLAISYFFNISFFTYIWSILLFGFIFQEPNGEIIINTQLSVSLAFIGMIYGLIIGLIYSKIKKTN